MTAKTTPVDPVQAAFDDAPIGEPETEEERRLVAEARDDIAAGRVRTPEQIRATIEGMRRRQESE
ncbi:MAG: hypothetical protein IPG50_17090 [Myxococcales bacterium]|nr:hypothetical protein [Myxococcales bacterium]